MSVHPSRGVPDVETLTVASKRLLLFTLLLSSTTHLNTER